jgi:hypothetical protein
MASTSLTGYDNVDSANGLGDAEVYLYGADADQLACISCNPSGARPAGRRFEGSSGFTIGVAARIPGWTTQLYASRALSDSGNRLFFESFDTLLPADRNGKADVYEWERVGSGDCDASAPSFSTASGGCLSLISSGMSTSDSQFVDASTSGDDVFFATTAGLLAHDVGLEDVYDARVNGGFPPPPTPPAPCEGEACQGLPSPPNDPTPGSSSFSGSGNLPPAGKAKKRAKKHRHNKASKRHRKSNANRHGRTSR